MKAKKEFFLKYIKDNEFTPQNSSKSLINNNLSLDLNNSSKSIEKNISPIKDKKSSRKYSFDKFVSEIKNYDYTTTSKWDNEARNYSINIDKNLNKIKLTELIQINYINPLLILNKEYIQENYQSNLLESELVSIEDKIKIYKNNRKSNDKSGDKKNYDIFDNTIEFIEKIMEKRERLELNKKILNYYLEYYIRNNYELMTPSMSKIRELTNSIDFYYDKIHTKKKKIMIMKKCNIDNTMKLILKKKRFENMTKLYSILKNNVLACYLDIKKLKLKSMNFNYIKYYEENHRLLNDIETIERNIIREFNENNNKLNNIKKFNVIEDIKNKLIRKKEKFNKIYNSEKNNIFNSKKSYIIHLYYLFNIEHNIQNNDENKDSNDNNEIKEQNNIIIKNYDYGGTLFVTEMEKIYKLKSKKIILEKVQYYKNKESQNINSIIIFNLNKPKLSDLKNVFIDEKNLTTCFKTIFVKLKNHVDIFFYYYNLISSDKADSNKYENLKNEIKSRKNEFYEILDKHLSKIVILLDNTREKDVPRRDITKKNLLICINLICLFEKLLKIKFSVKYNKYLNLALKNVLINQIKLENKKVIDKSMILLSNDIWDKNTLDPSFFNIDSIQERIPFYLRKFISFFNESEIKESLTSKLINKDNIDDIFNFINNNYDNFNNTTNSNNDITDINFDEVLNLFSKKQINNLKEEIEIENDIMIFNKPLKYASSYVTNSSCCILKGIEEQIINLIIFESLTYEIFYELFDTIDIYIFICFKMFLKDNSYLSKLLKNLNLKEIQKDIGNIEYWSDVASYQKKFLELKKFYISTEKKFCQFFVNDKEFATDEEKESFINNLIPKSNDIIVTKNKEKEENKVTQNQFSNLINNNLNIFNFKKNSVKNIRDIIGINNNDEKDNSTNENKNNNIEEDDDGMEPLNINQINDSNNNSNTKEKDKNESKSFLNFFYSNDTKKTQEIPIEEIIKEVKLKLSSMRLKEIIILISCILTLKKTLKRLVSFTTKIELELQRYQIISKLNKYEKLIEQMRNLFYMKISSEILDFSKISYLIEEYNWSPNPEEGSTQLFEASGWVNKLKSLFEVIVCEIHNKYYDLFGEKKITQFIIILVKFIIEGVQDSFAKIKKCNDMGRSIMLKDIKLLKEGIESTLKKYNYYKNLKTNILFDIIIQYANAWYYDKDELTKFIFNYNIQYKYFESLMNSSPIISELSNEIKNELVSKVKQHYLNQFKKIISQFKDNN